MKRQAKWGYLLIVLIAVIPWQAVPAQDISALLKAVDKIEASLAEMVQQEAATRDKQINELKNAMAGLDGAATPAGGVTEEQLADVMAELATLRVEVSGLRRMLDNSAAQLASIDPDSWVSPGASDEQVEEVSQQLEAISDRLANMSTSGEQPAEPWNGIAFTGFVDASDFNDHNSGEASFGLDQVEVDITKEFSGQASLRADIEYVSDGAGGFDMDLEQGYLTWNFGSATKWSFNFGKFNAPIGFELLDAPDMFQYSHALVFDLGLPGNLTGMMLTAEFPAVVDWTFYVVNGWDVNTDNNKDKTIGTRVGFTPMSNLNFGFSAVSGAELDDNNSSRRTVIDWDMTYNPFAFWTVGWELNWGTESKVLANDASGSWMGFLIMSNWAIGDRFAMTTRFDYFDDQDGIRTGDTQKLWAFAWSPFMSIADGLGTLVEVRVDGSNEDIFTGSDGLPTGTQVSTAWEFTYGF